MRKYEPEGSALESWVERMRAGLWPVPLGMMLLAVALFFAVVAWDTAGAGGWRRAVAWLRTGSGDDARNLLTTLVSAIITMSSVVFSLTIVALTLAAAQFGSRLVRTYMTDLRTKLALGFFVMTILYCLLALRTVSSDMDADQVPQVMVNLGLVLGMACVLALLFFLHVVGRSIVADEVIGRVVQELEDNIAVLCPLPVDGAEPLAADSALPSDFDRMAAVVHSAQEGYVRQIRYDALVRLAARHGFVPRLRAEAGAFAVAGGWLAQVVPAAALTDDVAAAIQRAVVIGRTRTPTQDLEYSLRHLVDVGLRALSAAINDPNTALVVVDRLRGALSSLMQRELPPAVHRDAAGVPRVVGRTYTYDRILDDALSQMRHAAATDPVVICALLDALSRVAEHVRLPVQRTALLRHIDLVAEEALQVQTDGNRARIEVAVAAAVARVLALEGLQPPPRRAC